MTDHPGQWTTAAPFWPDLIQIGLPLGLDQADPLASAEARAEFQRPSILRFTRDTFMEEFINLLENDPDQIQRLRAIRETWRGPATSTPQVEKKPVFERPFALRKALAERAIRSGKPFQTLKELVNPDTPPGDMFGSLPQALKLYQPAHMRHYLVTACLVCQTSGLPDRALNSAAQERVGFVVRRLIPHDAQNARRTGNPYPADEYALVKENGLSGWKPVDALQAKTLLKGEEQQGLFPVSLLQAEGRRRRLFAGVVPVGRREAYMGAAKLSDLSGPAVKALRPGEHLLLTQVTEPWKRLIETKFAAEQRINPVKPNQPPSEDEELPVAALTAFLAATRSQIQANSWLILLDFARLLQQFLPNIWAFVNNPAAIPPANTPEAALVDKIRQTTISDANAAILATGPYTSDKIARSLDAALRAIVASGPVIEHLETGTDTFDINSGGSQWPNFLFPLADPVINQPSPPRGKPSIFPPDDILNRLREPIDYFQDALRDALDPQSTQPSPERPLVSIPIGDSSEGWFVIRCVMERPECDPRLSPAVVSEPTLPFQMAGFFDPDAPARPIRINLPVDTTPAGLRKFDKNTAFVMSDVLCGQVQRARGMSLGDLIRVVLPWPLHKDLQGGGAPCADPEGAIGLICSLSIPIITICALILLIIIVSLLDLIFHWLPYFILCFPLPKFSAKESS